MQEVDRAIQGEILRDDPDDPPDADRECEDGRVMYELDRRLVVARLRRGRRLKAERGGFAGGGVRYGSPPNASSSSPTGPSGKSPTASAGCTGAACRSERSLTSSTPSRSQPNAAAPGTRPPSPGSFGGQHEHLLAGRAAGARSAGQPAPRRTGRRPPVGRGSPPTTTRSIAPQGRTTPSSLLAVTLSNQNALSRSGTSIPAVAALRAAITNGRWTPSRSSPPIAKAIGRLERQTPSSASSRPDRIALTNAS